MSPCILLVDWRQHSVEESFVMMTMMMTMTMTTMMCRLKPSRCQASLINGRGIGAESRDTPENHVVQSGKPRACSHMRFVSAGRALAQHAACPCEPPLVL